MRRVSIALIIALWPPVVSIAQTPGENHTQWVADAKAELIAHGADMSGPCGSFQIVNLTAYRHRDVGLGILSKPNGNGCEWPAGSGNRYSVDWIVYKNGQGGDMIIGSETTNTPSWELRPPDPVAAALWREPIAPAWNVPPVPPVTPPAGGGGADLSAVLSRLSALEGAVSALQMAVSRMPSSSDYTSLADAFATVKAGVGSLSNDVMELKGRPVPTTCRAAINFGFGKTPISCSLQ